MHPSLNIPHQFLLKCFDDPSSSSTSVEWTLVLETITSNSSELNASLLKDLFEVVPDLFYKSFESAKERMVLKLLEDWISAENPCPPLPSSVPDFLFLNSDYECGVDIDRSSLDVLLTLLRKTKMTSQDDQTEDGGERQWHDIRQFIIKKRETLPNSIADLESVCKEVGELIPFSKDKNSFSKIKPTALVAQKCVNTTDGNIMSQVDTSDYAASENGYDILLESDYIRTEQQAAPNCTENELLKQIANTIIADTSIIISQGPSGNGKISPVEVHSGTVIGDQIFQEGLSVAENKNDKLHDGTTLAVNKNDILHEGTLISEDSKEIMEEGHLSIENAPLTASGDDSLHEASSDTENCEYDRKSDPATENDYLISHEVSLASKFNFLKRITSSIQRGLFGIPSRTSVPSDNENNNEMLPGTEDGINVVQEDPLVRNNSDENLHVGPQIVEYENPVTESFIAVPNTDNDIMLNYLPVTEVGSKLLQPPLVTEDDNKTVQGPLVTENEEGNGEECPLATQNSNVLLRECPPVTDKTNESQGHLVIEMDIKSMEEVPSTYPECLKQHVNKDDSSQENHSDPGNQPEKVSPHIFVQNNEEHLNEKHESIQVLPKHEVVKGDRMTVDLCFNCHKGGFLSLCRDANCCVVFHEKCLDPLDRDEQGRSYCPFCFYKQALMVYHTTKNNYSQAKKSFKHFYGKDAAYPMKHKRTSVKDEKMSRKCRRTAFIKEEVEEEIV